MKSSIILKNVLPLDIFDHLNDELYDSWTLDNQSYDNGKLSWGKNTNQENSLLILEASSIIRLKIMKHTLQRVKLCRVQVNGLTNNQICEPHQDYKQDQFYTFIFFANTYWDVSWGGDFVCKNPLTQNIEYAPNVPNTGCLLPSTWMHYGQSPNGLTDALRITIGFSYTTY